MCFMSNETDIMTLELAVARDLYGQLSGRCKYKTLGRWVVEVNTLLVEYSPVLEVQVGRLSESLVLEEDAKHLAVARNLPDQLSGRCKHKKLAHQVAESDARKHVECDCDWRLGRWGSGVGF